MWLGPRSTLGRHDRTSSVVAMSPVVQVWSRHLSLRDERHKRGQRRSAPDHLQSPKTFMQVRTTSFLW